MELQKGREWVKIPPRKVSCTDDRWVVEERIKGKTYRQSITGRTLRDQRGYHQHEDGRWSRYAGGVSENSLS